MAILFCPIVFGLAGLVLGIVSVAISRNKGPGIFGIIISILGMILGFILGIALMASRGLRF